MKFHEKKSSLLSAFKPQNFLSESFFYILFKLIATSAELVIGEVDHYANQDMLMKWL